MFRLSPAGRAGQPPATFTRLAVVAEVEVQRRSGPAPGATREEVVALAREHFLESRRIDVQAIAQECGLARTTMYRWFGSRQALLSEAMLGVFEARIADARAVVPGHGAPALLDTVNLIYRGLVVAPHLRSFISRERQVALRVITSSTGQVHPRTVELITEMIDAEVERGDYEAATDTRTLAYVLVRLAEAMLFNYETDAIPKDMQSMREVQAALLGASPR